MHAKNRILSAALVLVLFCAINAMAAPAPVGPFEFKASAVGFVSRGVKIPAVLTLPVVAGKVPLVVMAHGHGGSKDENGGFTAIAEALAARGIASIRMDFPGCGASAEPFTANNVSNMVADFEAARAFAQANPAVDPKAVGAFGYSMGGRIAILSSAKGYKSLGLLAPVGTDGADAMYSFMGGAKNYAELSAKAKADGHVIFTTPFGQVQDLSASWFTDNEAAKGLSAMGAYKKPILIVTGTADTIITAAIVRQTAQAATKSPIVEVVQVAGADHGYGFYGGDPALKAQTVEAIASFFALTLR